MSIFKETFRNFVFTQLRVREAIMKLGNKGDSRFNSVSNFSPRQEIKDKEGKTKKITIDAGAFYTNTVNKQCVIRMCSGVDIKRDEETTRTLFENTRYEKAKDLVDEGLAIRYILEGGVPTKNLDFVNKEGNRDFSKPIKVIPRGRGNRGFGKSYGSTYGDPYLRSDATDGFGIVPMPGITDAEIRTKTAYGSLREAKVNFICHNRRQLEVLELLYMRIGYPILLEWGWDPFINNEGKRESYFPYINQFFDQNSKISEINTEIIRRKAKSGGNYDGFIGFVKNFDISSREDGGYNCTTELIAMGEALEGLKGRNSQIPITRQADTAEYKTQQEIVSELDLIFQFGDIMSRATFSKTSDLDHNRLDSLKVLLIKESKGYVAQFIKLLASSGIFRLSDIDLTQEELDSFFSDKTYLDNAGRSIKDDVQLGTYNSNVAMDYAIYRKINEGIVNFFSPYLITSGQVIIPNQVKTERDFIDNAFGLNLNVESKSQYNYIRWDFLVELLNKVVIERYKDDEANSESIASFTYLRDPISKEKSSLEYLEYNKYSFKEDTDLPANVDQKIYKNAPKGYKVEELVDMSIDPSICILPHQIPDLTARNIDAILDNFPEDSQPVITDRSIGLTYINLGYLKDKYESMKGDEDGDNNKLNLLDFIKEIWEKDINGACAGTHNFIVHNEVERPDVLRIIDMQAHPDKSLQPSDLFEFKIQSNQSIVRDFNYSTTIPSSLSSTIAVAAQSPDSIDNLDQVTFQKFNKFTKYRFNNTQQDNDGPSSEAIKRKEESYNREIEELTQILKKIALYRHTMLFGVNQDDAVERSGGSKEDIESISKIKGYIKGMEKRLISIKSKHSFTDESLKQYKGFYKDPQKTNIGKSAVIPLKLNAVLDGISGMVIGNLFKVEKNKLPIGYQGDDVAFAIMGESQKITVGQDWTTEINGQLILLDLAVEEATTTSTTQDTEQSEEPVVFDPEPYAERLRVALHAVNDDEEEIESIFFLENLTKDQLKEIEKHFNNELSNTTNEPYTDTWNRSLQLHDWIEDDYRDSTTVIIRNRLQNRQFLAAQMWLLLDRDPTWSYDTYINEDIIEVYRSIKIVDAKTFQATNYEVGIKPSQPTELQEEIYDDLYGEIFDTVDELKEEIDIVIEDSDIEPTDDNLPNTANTDKN